MTKTAAIWTCLATLACLFELGCEPAPPQEAYDLGLKFEGPEVPAAEDAEDLREAVGDILGVEVFEAQASRGAYTIFLYAEVRPGGESAGGDTCYRSGWSYLDPESIAHEIGHLSRLEHEEFDRSNLMHPTEVGTFELREDQAIQIRRELWLSISNCNPAWMESRPE